MERPGVARFHNLVRRERCIPVRHRGARLRRIGSKHLDMVTHLAGGQDSAGRPDVGARPVQVARVYARGDALGIAHAGIVWRTGAVVFQIEHERVVETRIFCPRRQIDEGQESQPMTQLVQEDGNEVDPVGWSVRVQPVVPARVLKAAGVPIVLLNVALMSSPASRSLPCRALPKATAYQVLVTGAPVKSRNIRVGPAEPRTAELAVHDRGLNWAWTRIVTALERSPPQMSAAAWNAISRCWPIVVPLLPPTGAAAVASLNPSPAPSVLTMTKVAACAAGNATNPKSATASKKIWNRLLRSIGCAPGG
jgi:hypothetical protein